MTLKKLLISLTSILLFSMSLLIIIYSLFLYKPNSAVQFFDKFLVNEYKLEYKEIVSEKKFFEPKLTIKNFSLKDKVGQDILNIERFSLSIDFLKTIKSRYLNLSLLEIEGFNLNNQSNLKNLENSFKLRINDLNIKTNDLDFQSQESYIINADGETSILNFNGKLNNVNFSDFRILIIPNSDKFLYQGNFNLNEKIIKENNLIDLKNFSDYLINLSLESQGYLDKKTGTIKNLNKYTFTESRLATVDDYLIKNINLVLFDNLNQSLSGIFSSTLPDQNISGSMLIKDKKITLHSFLKYEMSEILDQTSYFSLEGYEEFKSIITIINGKISLDLETDFLKTKISSILEDLKKNRNERLDISIKIPDLSRPTYSISSDRYNSYIGENNNGYFIFGKDGEGKIKNIDTTNGFHIFLNLKDLNIEDILINRSIEGSDFLSSITLEIQELNIFKNTYKNQNVLINTLNNETNIIFSGEGLNGSIREDKTGFIKIELFDTKFEFEEFKSNNFVNLENINLRFIGKNIETYNSLFEKIDFYFLSNEKIITIDNINVVSKFLKIGQYSGKQKAYISHNKINDLYKVRGSYEISNSNHPLKGLINYNFKYLSTDLNIQWVSLEKLKDIEGNIEFLIKDFESKATLPDSTFFKALKIFNLNAIIENINNETSITSTNLFLDRAEGDFYVGKNRAIINNPIKIETPEANMRWAGEVMKDSNGLLDELNLNLEMRLKVSENIPLYAALFGGVPALAGGLFFENIFDERLDDASTFKFKIHGSIEKPVIDRLD